jgi:hypothetical protein
VDPGAIPVVDDGGVHEVRIVLGAANGRPQAPPETSSKHEASDIPG